MKKRFLSATVLFILDVLFVFLFRQYSSFFFPAYRTFSKMWISFLAKIFSVSPFTLWDIGALLLLIFCLVTLILSIRKRKFLNWLSHVILIVSVLCFITCQGWMLNHYAPKLSEEISLDIREYTLEELYDACDYYLVRAGKLAPLIERDEEGHALDMDLDELAASTGASYAVLSGNYPVFEGSTLPVKRFSLLGDYLLYNGIVGMFMPITGESAVPAHDPPVTVAFSMAHEAAHRLGIAAEEEANFAAFLGCVFSEDIRLLYSGYYNAFSYTFSSLYRADPEKAAELIGKYKEDTGILLVRLDRQDTRAIYDRYESPLEDISNDINDTYLKTFDHESGIASYGEVTDYLIAWYLLTGKGN